MDPTSGVFHEGKDSIPEIDGADSIDIRRMNPHCAGMSMEPSIPFVCKFKPRTSTLNCIIKWCSFSTTTQPRDLSQEKRRLNFGCSLRVHSLLLKEDSGIWWHNDVIARLESHGCLAGENTPVSYVSIDSGLTHLPLRNSCLATKVAEEVGAGGHIC